MATKEKGPNTAVIVAIIGVIGVLGAAIIANWNTFFPPENGPPVEPTTESPVGGPPVEPPPKSPEETATHARPGLEEARKEAEKIAKMWGEAWWTGRMDAVVELSKPPFWYAVELLRSKVEIARDFQARLQVGTHRFRLVQIASGIIRELKESGKITEDHPLLLEVGLADNDIYVLMAYRTGPANGDTLDNRVSFMLYFRRTDEGVQLVGFDA